MAILNPSFEDAGALPGEAEHWTLSAVTSLEEIAGFGAAPKRRGRTSSGGSTCSTPRRRRRGARVLRQRAQGLRGLRERLGQRRLPLRAADRAARHRAFGGARARSARRGGATSPTRASGRTSAPRRASSTASRARTSRTSGAQPALRLDVGGGGRPRCSTAARRPSRTSTTAGRAATTHLRRRAWPSRLDVPQRRARHRDVDRGVTAGIARPPGGGSFLYAFNSLAPSRARWASSPTSRASRRWRRAARFAACVQRGPGGGPTGFSPFLFLCCQGNSVNDSAYLLGLSDDDPHRIVLRKGAVAVGLPTADGPGVLLKSAASFAQATWLHLRLDVIVNTNGDVVLKVFQNDLARTRSARRPTGSPSPGWWSSSTTTSASTPARSRSPRGAAASASP
jgi:hypothetical protein